MIRLDATPAGAAAHQVGTVIMLHGWAQNSRVFHNKTLKLAKKLCNAGYDVIYPEAPHILPMKSITDVEGQPVEIRNGGRKNARAWFTYIRDDPCDTSESQTGNSIEYIGLDESIGIIGSVLKGCVEADGAPSESSERKIIALLGFSQGGTFAHILASLAEGEGASLFRHIDGVVCIGSFPAKHTPTVQSKYRPCLDKTIGVQSLHVVGENDTSVHPKLLFSKIL